MLCSPYCGSARLSSYVSEIKLAFRILPERPMPTPAAARKLSPLIDRINTRYGRGACCHPPCGHAAFRRVPERWDF